MAAIVLAAAGCGGPSSLSGVVTLDGAPLDGATVVLTPEESGAEMVVGTTGPDGRFRITSASGRAIKPGKYKIVVNKGAPSAKGSATPPPEIGAPGPPPGLLTHRKELLPAKYSDWSQTVLSVTVPTTDELNLQLTSR